MNVRQELVFLAPSLAFATGAGLSVVFYPKATKMLLSGGIAGLLLSLVSLSLPAVR